MPHEPTTEHQITGAFGTIRAHDEAPRKGARARLLTLVAILGPGLIVMVGDNDAGGISTYAQAGQNYGYTLLWTLPLLIPVLVVIQEMVARLGAVTGVGHGRLIRERFGRFWGNTSIFSILVLNFLIIVTEFIGVSLSMEYLGVRPLVSVPVAVVVLFAVTATGSFRRWERFMMLFIAVNFVIVPLAVVSHPVWALALHHAVVPSVRGGASSAAVLLVISIIGTTVAPWQLFFQESNIVDKRISPRWLNYERVDTIVGAFVVVAVASVIVAACAAGLAGHGGTNAYTSALGVARGLRRFVGPAAGAMYAILLLNSSVIGAAVVTLASSYAIGDLSSTHQGLDARFGEAKGFYGGYAALLVVAGAVAVIPGAPLGTITLAVQALCGLMLPYTTIIVLLLSNDVALMGPWKNGRWLNALAIVMIVALVVLSLDLMISTLFTTVPVLRLLVVLSIIGGLGLLVGLPIGLRRMQPPPTVADRREWRTPRLTLLEPMAPSRWRAWLMRSQAAFLAVAGVLLVVRIVQLLTS